MGNAINGSDAEENCLIRPMQLITISGRSEYRSEITLSLSSTSISVNKNEASLAEKKRRRVEFRMVATTSKWGDKRNARKTATPSIPLAPKIRTFVFLTIVSFATARVSTICPAVYRRQNVCHGAA